MRPMRAYVFQWYIHGPRHETAAPLNRLFATGRSLGNNVHLSGGGGGGLMMRVIAKFQRRKQRAAEPSPHPSGFYVPRAGCGT